jgi:hypothetical protein
VTTFSITFNNHSVAAYAALFSVAPILLGWKTFGWWVVSGFFAGLAVALELPAAAWLAAFGAIALVIGGRLVVVGFAPAALLPVGALLALNYAELGDWKPAYEKIESEWYRYEGSHWDKRGSERRGIDYAGDQETRATYAFHLLLGHHGWFSLTPIWFLTLGGLIGTMLRWREFSRDWRLFNLAIAMSSVVVIVFYAGIVGTVNYGGWTSGPRWFFWLTPLWLIAMLPAADAMGRTRGGRWLALVLLAISIFSASFPVWNPWRHPWIYRAMETWGWPGY